MLPTSLTEEIKSCLQNIKPFKIILFGSYAWGNPSSDSDIDLLVVTDDDFFPETFHDKNRLYLNVSYCLTELEKKYPIDLIVHTKAMHRKFIDRDSMFAKKIIKDGKILHEANHR